MAAITLYGPARAPYTEKVRRALLYKKLPFELREPTRAEDYKLWSPKSGLLPVLELDGERLEDSTAILLELDRRFPEPPLLSADPTVAAQQRQLEDWSDESLLWYWTRYRHLIGAGTALPLAGEAEPDPEPDSGLRASLRRFADWLRAGGTWEQPVAALIRELGLRLDDVTKLLGGRPFFYADRLSLADLGVYSMLCTLRDDSIPGSARLLGVRPGLVAYMARVEQATPGTGTP